MSDLARPGLVLDVVNLDPAGPTLGLLGVAGAEQLLVDQHHIAVHPHLVRMHKARDLDPARDTRLAVVADIDERGAVWLAHVADISEVALGDDLPSAGNIELGEMLQDS